MSKWLQCIVLSCNMLRNPWISFYFSFPVFSKCALALWLQKCSASFYKSIEPQEATLYNDLKSIWGASWCVCLWLTDLLNIPNTNETNKNIIDFLAIILGIPFLDHWPIFNVSWTQSSITECERSCIVICTFFFYLRTC